MEEPPCLALTSMEPRLVGRGGGARLGETDQTVMLQWGPGVLAEDGETDLVIDATTNTLQWGHGNIAAEGKVEVVGESILPLLRWGRGSSAAEVGGLRRRRRAPVASMGPPLISRGGIVCDGDSIMAGQLQWGRGCSAAEEHLPRFPRDDLGASMGPRLDSRGGVCDGDLVFHALVA